MPKHRKISTLDGYATLKAVARSATTPPKPATAQPVPAAPPQKIAARVARTVLPAKHLIECYECGYRFQLHGRASSINCSKCRVVLDLTDQLIEREWTGTLKTAGTIRVAAGAVLRSGQLIGNDIVLDGILEGGSVRAMRELQLGPAAVFSEKAIAATDLKIAAAARVTLKQPARYRNVEVAGSLTARLAATGTVTIRSGGSLQGELRAAHLVVEDGAGLIATVRVSPTEAGCDTAAAA